VSYALRRPCSDYMDRLRRLINCRIIVIISPISYRCPRGNKMQYKILSPIRGSMPRLPEHFSHCPCCFGAYAYRSSVCVVPAGNVVLTTRDPAAACPCAAVVDTWPRCWTWLVAATVSTIGVAMYDVGRVVEPLKHTTAAEQCHRGGIVYWVPRSRAVRESRAFREP